MRFVIKLMTSLLMIIPILPFYVASYVVGGIYKAIIAGFEEGKEGF